jgi:hypothetical protein
MRLGGSHRLKSRRVGSILSKILHMNFHEKAHFVKPTWRLLSVAERNGFFSALRALCFHPHSQ